jgi:DNA-binding MarR family transcriptional regulator
MRPGTQGRSRAADIAAAEVADELLTAMSSIRRGVRRLAGRPAELAALTGAQVELVRLLRRRPGLTVNQAAEELGLAPNTVSTLVRQLAGAEVLIRRVDETDRRVVHLELTREMRNRTEAFRDRRVAFLGEAIAELPQADQRRMLDTVRLLGRLSAEVNDRFAPVDGRW